MTWQARAPGCGPTALRGTIPTGSLVSQTPIGRIVATFGVVLGGTTVYAMAASRHRLAPCAGCPRLHLHHARWAPTAPTAARTWCTRRLRHLLHLHLHRSPMEASSNAQTRALFQTTANATTVALVLSRLRRRPRPSLTSQPSAPGRLGAQRASLSAAISQASIAPRRTPLCGPSSLKSPMCGSARLTL
jgi:hypothetical protein